MKMIPRIQAGNYSYERITALGFVVACWALIARLNNKGGAYFGAGFKYF
jgi:hypothetical protein